MTDIHSHILPNMDDGAKSPEMSCEMLMASREQGVDSVVLSPHFYPDREAPASFLSRRLESAKKLLSTVEESGNSEKMPEMFLGAEVAFYEGISHTGEIENLCIAGTDYLMIEMPFVKWSKRTVEELFRVKDSAGVQIILAHIDRYFSFFDKSTLSDLLYHDVILQTNAEAFTHFSTRRRVLPMVGSGDIKFLGSDCHNTDSRKPNISAALTQIKKKLGEDALYDLEAYSRWIKNKALPLKKAVEIEA